MCLDVSVDDVLLEKICFHVVPDDAQALDVIIGRTFTDHSRMNYCKEGDKLTFTEASENFLSTVNLSDPVTENIVAKQKKKKTAASFN